MQLLGILFILYLLAGLLAASYFSILVHLPDYYDDCHRLHGDYEEIKDKPDWEKFTLAFLVLMIFWPEFIDLIL